MNARKYLALALAAVLLVGCTIFGTMAWLSAQTESVTNTFSPSTVGLELKESPLKRDKDNKVVDGISIEKVDADDTNWKYREVGEDGYKLIPGFYLEKDPAVKVTKGSEKCFVFVKIEEENNTAKTTDKDDNPISYIEYEIGSNWTPVKALNEDGIESDKVVPGVYVYTDENGGIVDASNGSVYLEQIFAEDKVSVNELLTLEDMKQAAEKKPHLVLTAYATQAMKSNNEAFTPAKAWTNASK